ncbi:dihydrofolate reductase family protein, partial [Microcella sp.]|uniref:dihydrofolate reductase family protein n=1 Tax=Microcella sp. TaxID=1913979 RepID=UPI003F72B7F8
MLRRVVPVEGGELDVDHPDARRTLLDWYEPHSPEHVRLTFVSTLDGRAAGGDGTSESLTTRTDRMILGVIRQHADVVLVGAETVRRAG